MDELRMLLMGIDQNISDEQVQVLMAEADENGDGKIDF